MFHVFCVCVCTLTSMTHSSWIFCISFASWAARSGCSRERRKHALVLSNVVYVILAGMLNEQDTLVYLLAPGRLEALEFLYVASIEGI